VKTKIAVAIIAAAFLISGIFLWHNISKAPQAPKIVKSKVAKKVKPKIEEKARVAIVMDDFGYNTHQLDAMFSIDEPITLSILPDLPYSRKVAESARQRGYEVILHLPLEPHRNDVSEEAGTIKSGMPEEEVRKKLTKDIARIPGLTGVSNHMGSKATEDAKLMLSIFKYLKKQRLYFFDSLTSEVSVCRETAKLAGIKYARRDIFLDNSEDPVYIEKQLKSFEEFALKNGKAIAVCHDRKNTVAVLAKVMPSMAKRGIKFVFLKEMVK